MEIYPEHLNSGAHSNGAEHVDVRAFQIATKANGDEILPPLATKTDACQMLDLRGGE